MNKLFSLPILAAIALFCASLTGITGHSNAESSDSMTENSPRSARLSAERLFASPGLNGPTAKGVKFSPDGKRVTFLKSREDDASRYDLWQFMVESGEQSLLVDSKILEPEEVTLSEAEKALRERKRIAGQKGILSYDWGSEDTILVPLGGDLHLITLGETEPVARQLTSTDAFEYDAKVSPKGKSVSFIRDGALFVIDLASGEETRISPDAEPDNAISYGVAEFVAQEEMSRYTGYWWSLDDRYIAYTRVDESSVDIIERFDIAADKSTVIDQRYPRAGRPNAIVDLFVRDMETGETRQVEQVGPDTYLARVNWLAGELQYQIVDRAQKTISFKMANGPDWKASTGYRETLRNWVNLSDDYVPFREGVLRTDEKSGFRHITYHRHGIGPGQVQTSGDWVVDRILYADEETGIVYFTGYKDTPLERHLYGVPANGGTPVRLTEDRKSWAITMGPDGKSFVGTSSSPDHPPQTGLYRTPHIHTDEELEQMGAQRTKYHGCIDTTPMSARMTVVCPESEIIAWVEENRLDENHPYFPYLPNHTVPTYGKLKAEDGQTLYYSVQLPPDFDSTKKYPVIVEVYGGPHVQTVTRDWERMTDQFYTHQGYIVFRLDNRGSYNRGKAFEDVIYRQTGGPEVRDQLLGVNWLKSQSYVDPERIAIQGWSYGGYMTLMTMLQAEPGTFAAAVSGAPVTDWSLYDTFYTERYMDTPQNNPDGYEKASVFYHLDEWEGELPPLMLIHGMADDNVTFDNTTRLMAQLQEKGLLFELMTYPGQRHGIRGEALQTHLMKTRMAFLNRHLKPGE